MDGLSMVDTDFYQSQQCLAPAHWDPSLEKVGIDNWWI